VSCDYLGGKCKYNYEGRCGFPYGGSGYPYDAPCFEYRDTAEWEPVRMNKRMVKCSKCSFMANKDLVYDHTQKQPLVFDFCPVCGSKMKGGA
jgi:hypothetical protein